MGTRRARFAWFETMLAYKRRALDQVTEYLDRRALSRIIQRNKAKNPPKMCFTLDSVGQGIILNGVYEERYLKAIFEGFLARRRDEFLGATALDVGANVGNHSLYFASRFKRVLSFEPNPLTFKLLEVNVALNGASNVTPFRMGLGADNSELPFVSPERANFGEGHFLQAGETAAAVERLPVVKADDHLMQVAREDRIALVKIDVEGFELEVITGMKETLSQFGPVVIFEANPEKGATGAAIARALSEIGYGHFYTIEQKSVSKGVPRPVRILSRFLDPSVYAHEVDSLESRFYSTVLALREPA